MTRTYDIVIEARRKGLDGCDQRIIRSIEASSGGDGIEKMISTIAAEQQIERNPRSRRVREPAEGDLRAWFQPALGANTVFYQPVRSVAEAQAAIALLADYDQALVDAGLKPDHSNTSGLEVFEAGEWQEWENAEGATVTDLETPC